MTPHKSLIEHDPENGKWGDCFRTAIACLLDLPPDAVPHVCSGGDGTDADAMKAMEEWLSENHGLAIMSVTVVADIVSMDEALQYMGSLNQNIYYLFVGKSRTGCVHNVVCLGGEIVHDPTPGDPGIVGPCDDGCYWFNFLTPCFKKAGS